MRLTAGGGRRYNARKTSPPQNSPLFLKEKNGLPSTHLLNSTIFYMFIEMKIGKMSYQNFWCRIKSNLSGHNRSSLVIPIQNFRNRSVRNAQISADFARPKSCYENTK